MIRAVLLCSLLAGSAGAQLFPFKIDAGDWYNASWSNRVSVTVQSSQIDSNLTAFPVYMDLSDLPAGFHTAVRSDGGDIRVTAADGLTELPREVVFYDAGTDTGELHLAGDLSSSVDTVFYIYYGNAGATDYAVTDPFGAENAWDSSFAAVWHLQEDPSGTAPQIIDSTSNGQDGTSAGTMLTGDSISPGQLSGRALNFDGSDDVIRRTAFSVTGQPATICAWFRLETYTDATMYFATLNDTGAGDDALALDVRDSDDVALASAINAGVGSDSAALGTVSVATWQRACGAFISNTSRKIYLGDQAPGASGVSVTITGLDRFSIGNRDQATPSGWFDGDLDEVRISSIERPEAWIDAETRNQSSPATFYTVGAEESQ